MIDCVPIKHYSIGLNNQCLVDMALSVTGRLSASVQVEPLDPSLHLTRAHADRFLRDAFIEVVANCGAVAASFPFTSMSGSFPPVVCVCE